MARAHGVSANTYKKFVVDSGAVYYNYTTSPVLVGATRSGNTFTVETDYRDMVADGAKGPVKGGRRIVGVVATLTVNLLEMSTAMLTKILTGSAATDYPTTPGKTHDKIVRSLAITDANYLTDIALVGEVTGGGANPAVFIIYNPICDGNFEMGLTDNEESVIAATFKGHFSPAAMDTEPWEIRFPVIP